MTDAAQRARTMGMPVGAAGGMPEVATRNRADGCAIQATASALCLLVRDAQAALQILRSSSRAHQQQTQSRNTSIASSGC